MAININRPFETRLVTWEGSVRSNTVLLLPGAAWNLYLPPEFVGASITIYAFVNREVHDAVNSFKPIQDFKLYDNGALSVTADVIHDLTALNLFGLNRIQIQSNLSETCVGEISLSS